MNTSLKEYAGRSTYGTRGIKRETQKSNVTGYAIQEVEAQNDYPLVQQCQTLTQSDIEATGFPHRGFYRANRGLVVLNGERYELVGKIVTGGMIESVVVRAAVDDSIDDGTINYNRLTTRVTRKQASRRLCNIHKVARRIADSEVVSGIDQRLKNAFPSSSDTSSRKVVIAVTGTVAEKTVGHFGIDWYGGGKLRVERSRAEGDWDQLEVGQWIEATILRQMNGEVVRAMLIGTIDEPKGFTEEELTESYSSIPAANLDPVE